MGSTNTEADRLYTVLGVRRDASRADIRKAHQRLAREHHPDRRGGDAETFKEIQKAYETLSDPERRAKYDQFGEHGLETDESADLFDFMRQRTRQQRRPRTKNVVTTLKVTLEELYIGKVKKMAVNRQVVDTEQGIQTCQACAGRGINAEMRQLGSHSACEICNGTGKSCKYRREREVLEVHVQRGSPDGHTIRFPEKADELPGADTGDVIFTLKEQEHPIFKRKGADLYIERKISLVEALCGFEMEVDHLDGRKLLVKTAPGDVTRPMQHGFDPLANHGDGVVNWECFDGYDCRGIESVAKADSADIDMLKQACQTQLKRRGLDIGAFVVDETGAHFKQCTRSEALAAKEPRAGAKLFVVGDPTAAQESRMIKAIVGQGMPTIRNPFVYGNLFLILTIDFPHHLPEEASMALRELLPPPLNEAQADPDDPSIEVHTVSDIDPTASYLEHAQTVGEAYDEDDEPGRRGGIPMNQCHQM